MKLFSPGLLCTYTGWKIAYVGPARLVLMYLPTWLWPKSDCDMRDLGNARISRTESGRHDYGRQAGRSRLPLLHAVAAGFRGRFTPGCGKAGRASRCGE